MVTKRAVGKTFTGKKITKSFTCYVEYSLTDLGFEIHTAYLHNSEIIEERTDGHG
jgi:hypothetical protein